MVDVPYSKVYVLRFLALYFCLKCTSKVLHFNFNYLDSCLDQDQACFQSLTPILKSQTIFYFSSIQKRILNFHTLFHSGSRAQYNSSPGVDPTASISQHGYLAMQSLLVSVTAFNCINFEWHF